MTRTDDLWSEGGVFDQLSAALGLVPQHVFDHFTTQVAVVTEAAQKVENLLCCHHGCVRCAETQAETD